MSDFIIYNCILYVTFVFISLANMGISGWHYCRSRRTAYILMGITNLFLVLEAIVEVIGIAQNATASPSINVANAMALLGLLFTRFPLILYMWVVVRRLYKIRFLWPRLKTWHCILLYSGNIVFWCISILIQAVLIFVQLDNSDEDAEMNYSASVIDFFSYGTLVITTILVNYTVIHILAVRRQVIAPNTELLRAQHILILLFSVSSICFFLSLLFWMIPTYDTLDDPNGAFIEITWIISYTTTAFHFTLEVFLQQKISLQLEAISSNQKVNIKKPLDVTKPESTLFSDKAT